MSNQQLKTPPAQANHSVTSSKRPAETKTLAKKPVEVGGPKGPEPTRYGNLLK